MTYSEILARLETATGPDREIDARIAYAVDWTVGGVPFRKICEEIDGEMYWCGDLPPYTASLDAVVALIESELPGWWWQVRSLAGGKFTAAAAESPRPERQGKGSFGLTPPLALLTAAVRALADKEAA
jgi:hypothetical protein